MASRKPQRPVIAVDLASLHERLLDSASEAILATDTDGVVVYLNATAERLYGWGGGEMVGQRLLDITVQPHLHACAEEVLQRLQSGQRWSGECQLRRRDGSQFPAQLSMTPLVDDAGVVVAIIGVSSDVSVQEEEARRLVESERLFRTLTDRSPDAIVRFDREHRSLFANPRMCELLGLPADSIIGRRSSDFEVPEVAAALEALEAAVERAFTSGAPTSTEIEWPVRDGTVCLHYQVIPERESDGLVDTVLAVARDITDRRASEQRASELLVRIASAQQEERTRIGEDIHDDAIQVMVAVGMRLQVFTQKIEDPEALGVLGRLAKGIEASIRRLRIVMFCLLPPDLDAGGIAAALRTYLEVSGADSSARWHIEDELTSQPSAQVQTVLYQIAQEAIANARKHADASAIDITLDDHAGGIRLRVRDDGAGFGPDAVRDLGPHHIGMTAMRDRAAALGGKVDIDSVLGHGTIVSAWLPTPSSGAAGGHA